MMCFNLKGITPTTTRCNNSYLKLTGHTMVLWCVALVDNNTKFFHLNGVQHLNGVHGICGQERKQLIQGGLVGTEVMTREPQSNIKKQILFSDMLQCGEVLRDELIRKARLEEIKAILELHLNMKEGNLTMPTRNPHCTIITTQANRNISLSNKKKWMLEYNKILFNIISPALKE